MQIRPVIIGLAAGILDIVFPSRCVNCGVPVSFNEHCLCRVCLSRINPVKDGCGKCSAVITDGTCSVCPDRMVYFTRNIAIAEYDGVLETVMRHYKFNRRRRLHHHLSDMAFAVAERMNMEIDFITAVPMTGEKRWNRGFNQSELIARVLAGRLQRPYRGVLRENKRSKTQRNLRFRDRFVNVLGRYKVTDTAAVKSRRILLVDDIFTTGATVNECARVLTESGAQEVMALTIARAGKKT